MELLTSFTLEDSFRLSYEEIKTQGESLKEHYLDVMNIPLSSVILVLRTEKTRKKENGTVVYVFEIWSLYGEDA